jgi:hypothetical protein
MALLDRLRSQPKWKHADPEIRAAGLQELGPDDQDVFAELARQDPDARVRRAAVRRLMDPAILAEVLRGDADERVRDEASTVLQSTAISETHEATAMAAAAALDDPRVLGTITRTAVLEAVRRAAFDRLTDERALGGVARHGEDAALRLAALARLQDAGEIAAVAMNGEYRDAALAALDRLTDQGLIETIAARARQKVVARRAQARLRELGTDRPVLDSGARREPQQRLCERLEDLVAFSGEPADLGTRLIEIETEWSDLAPAVDPALGARFVSARDRAYETLERLERERVARAREARAETARIEARVAVCERLETCADTDVDAAIEAARRDWAALPPAPPDRAVELDARFERAAGSATARHAAWRAAEARRARFEDLASRAEPLPALDDHVEAGRQWAALENEWRDLEAGGPAPDDVRARLARVAAVFHGRAGAVRDEERRALGESLQRLERTCDRLDRLLAAPDLTLKQAERAHRELRALIEQLPPLPSRRDQERITARLQAARATLAPKLQELRDADAWQRWANVTIQEDLCAKAEALAAAADPVAAARQLNELRTRWQQASRVPHDRAEGLWRRFKAAHDQVRARSDAFFAQAAADRTVNLEKKKALCERAESLAESKDWIRTADAFKALQAEWKAIGPVARQDGEALWQRFRAACDRFFNRRAEDLARRKSEWAANLARKTALVERVESLLEPPDWDAAAAEVRRVQTEWKSIGPVRKNKSEAIWQRFRVACDQFFDRYRHRDLGVVQGALAERDAVCVELESLAASLADQASPPDGLFRRVQELRQQWQRPADLPHRQLDALGARFHAALTRTVLTCPAVFRGTDLDPDANRRKMEQLCVQVERLLPETPGADASPAAVLARQLREALAGNTIGRVDEETKWRAEADEVRKAQAAWKRLGPVPPDEARALSDRFRRACDRFFAARQRPRQTPRSM